MTTLIVGLGNPGARYHATRHNLGFHVVDRLAGQHGIAVNRSKSHALVGQGRIAGEAVVLVKPQTFMNLSGEAVGPLARFFQIPPERVLVVCDDFALPLGKLRLKGQGSDGGHNGLKSLIAHLGTQSFPRLRLGVGPVPPPLDPVDFVLGALTREERAEAASMVERAAEAVESFLEVGLEKSMGKFN